MFGANVVVVQRAGLVHRQLDHLTSVGGEPTVGLIGRLTGRPGRRPGEVRHVHLHSTQCVGRHRRAIADHTEHEVLGSNLTVTQSNSFFLGRLERATGAFGELVEAIGHARRCYAAPGALRWSPWFDQAIPVITRLCQVLRMLPVLALAGCSSVVSVPPQPMPEPFTALYVVRTGPYPLYENYGDWLANRPIGQTLSQIDELTMAARRVAMAQNRIGSFDGAWLHGGCIFDVEGTRPDEQETAYLWAFGRVFRCDEPIASPVPEPQMGVRPHALRIFDGLGGYFPMGLLEPYSGDPPAPRIWPAETSQG